MPSKFPGGQTVPSHCMTATDFGSTTTGMKKTLRPLPRPDRKQAEHCLKPVRRVSMLASLSLPLPRENSRQEEKPGAKFAKEKEAKTARLGKAALYAAMQRLLEKGRIRNETYGRGDRLSSRL